jgi:hypothetical protein
MSDSETKTQRSSLPTWLAVAAGLLLCAYPLSVGPCRWLYLHGYLGEEPEAVVQTFYWPLNFIGNHCPPLRALLIWYSSLWGK